VHNGLTPLGKAVVAEMNSAGMLIDLAHATFAVTKDAVEVSTRPVMISHTNLVTPGGVSHPRLISHEHAALVAAGGGIIGRGRPASASGRLPITSTRSGAWLTRLESSTWPSAPICTGITGRCFATIATGV
jgi:hypothetical protein